LGGSKHTAKNTIKTFAVTSNGIGLEMGVLKSKYIFMARDLHACDNHDINYKSFERAEKFRYLGTNQNNQNAILEEIKTRPKSSYPVIYGERAR